MSPRRWMRRTVAPAALVLSLLVAPDAPAAEPTLHVELLGQLQAEASEDAATLRLRRLRPILRGDAAGLEGLAVIDVARGGAEVIDASVGGAWTHGRWQVGQQKIPLTAFRQRSIARLGLVDWPVLSTWLGGERQLGAAGSLDDGDGDGWEAQLGLFEGRNARRAHGVAPALLFEGAAREATAGDLHPEGVARIGWRAGRRLGLSLGAAADAAPRRAEDASWRGAAELEGRVGRLHLEGVAQVADLPAPGRDAWGLRAWGGWVSAAWEDDAWGVGLSASGIALEAPLRRAVQELRGAAPAPQLGHANLSAWWSPQAAPWSLRADLQTATAEVAPLWLGRLLLQASF